MMDAEKRKQKLTTTETAATPSLSKMDPKKMKKQKPSPSETAIASLSEMDQKKTKKQKVFTSQVIPCPSQIDVREAMKKQNDVAMFLTGTVISTVAKDSNFIFSPVSINTVLTMAAASSGKEELRSFILSFLKASSIDELSAVFRENVSVVLADGSKSGGPKIAAVNGVWIEQTFPFSPSSKDLLVNFFKADFAQVDFRSKAEEVREEVNSWASKNTNGLIKNLLPPRSVTWLTDWIYGNALYFKGAWVEKFDKNMTKNKPFHLLESESVNVPFMSSHKKQYIGVYDDFKVLRLPYQEGYGDINRQFSMYLYLPAKKDGLDNLLERMTSTCGFLDSHIPRGVVTVGEFRIPKFKIEFGFEASKVFTDFDLEVSLYHKAFVEIDEEGTEAAAVSVLRGGRGGHGSFRPTKIDFVADHPFLFLIREDKTGTILFVGQIFDPSKPSPY